jgi:DNA-binding transcriptional regulator YiaG
MTSLLRSKKQERLNVRSQASRVTELNLPDIKEVREKTGLSQTEFAARLHISPRTLQNWVADAIQQASSNLDSYSRCASKPDLKL